MELKAKNGTEYKRWELRNVVPSVVLQGWPWTWGSKFTGVGLPWRRITMISDMSLECDRWCNELAGWLFAWTRNYFRFFKFFFIILSSFCLNSRKCLKVNTLLEERLDWIWLIIGFLIAYFCVLCVVFPAFSENVRRYTVCRSRTRK